MQILVNFETEGKCIQQSLPDTAKEVLLMCLLLSMTDRLINDIVLIVFPKICKNTNGQLEYLTSI